MKSLIRRLFFVGAGVCFTVFVLPVLYLLEPFKRIRIGAILADRIGHLGPNTELYCRRRQLGLVDTSAWTVFVSWNPVNRQLHDMYSRVLNIVESRWLRRAAIGVLPVLRRTRFYQDLPCTFQEHREFAEAKPSLAFTAEEKARGRAELARLGIGENDWFVCFHARDPAYLAKRPAYPTRNFEKDFRDCHVETYLKAVDWITTRGGYALRMGAIVDAPMTPANPKIIDYAATARSDFMDIFLAAHCRFWLGNGSGINYIPLLFDVPTAIANFCPYSQVGFGPRMMFIPKLLWHVEERRYLRFSEARALGLMGDWEGFAANYFVLDKKFGLEWRDNTPEDILDLTRDRMDAIKGIEPSPEAKRLQDIFRRCSNKANNTPLAGPIGPRFALKYRHLIEDESRQDASESAPLEISQGSVP